MSVPERKHLFICVADFHLKSDRLSLVMPEGATPYPGNKREVSQSFDRNFHYLFFIIKTGFMKKAALLSIYSLLFFSAQSQWLERTEAINTYSNEMSDLEVTSTGNIVVAGGSWNEGGFFVVNQQGELVFTENQLSGGTSIDVLELPNGDFIVAAEIFECDVFYPVIRKYDATWNLLWQTSDIGFWMPAGVTVSPAGDLLFFSYDQLIKTDANGQLIWTKNYSHVISSVVVSPENFIYMATENGLLKLDSSGTQLAFVPNYPFGKVVITPAGNIAGYLNDQVTLLDADLGFIAISDVEIVIRDMDVSADHLAVIGDPGDGSGASVVKVADASLNILHQFTVAEPQIKPDLVALHGNSVLLAGRELYSQNETAAFMKAYDFDGNTTDYETDAAITDAHIGAVSISYDQWYNAIKLSDVFVKIENKGNSLLESTTVSVRFPDIDIGLCYLPQLFDRDFDGLNLQPGESVTVEFGDVELYVQVPVSSLEPAFWTSVPNHHLDTDHSNDRFDAGVLVNIDPKHKPVLRLNIFPNPASEQCWLYLQQALYDDAALEIINSAGQVVQQGTLERNLRMKMLEINDLPAGMYFLKVKVAGLTYSYKLVKI